MTDYSPNVYTTLIGVLFYTVYGLLKLFFITDIVCISILLIFFAVYAPALTAGVHGLDPSDRCKVTEVLSIYIYVFMASSMLPAVSIVLSFKNFWYGLTCRNKKQNIFGCGLICQSNKKKVKTQDILYRLYNKNVNIY